MNPKLEELACLYVLDQLDPGERAAFESRLQHDPELVALVRDLESTVGAQVQALPQRVPPARLLAAIEARVDQASRRVAPAPGRSHAFAWAMLGGAAAVILLGLGLFLFRTWGHSAGSEGGRPVVIVASLEAGRSTLVWLPLKSEPTTADARFIQLARLAEQYWNRPEKLPAKLSAAAETARGYAVFDPDSDQGFVAVRQLPSPPPNQRYHFWVIDTATGETRDAGVLPLEASTRGMFFFSVPNVPRSNPRQLDFYLTIDSATENDAARTAGRVVLGQKSRQSDY